MQKATGSMMLQMAIDNIMINVVKDNDTSSNNLLDPALPSDGWSTRWCEDKYPYVDDESKSVRVNGTTGANGGSNQDASYPFWTGNYNKWMFANDVELHGTESSYASENTVYDSGDSVLDLVYEGNNLVTSTMTVTGGYGDTEEVPYEYYQYLSLENIRMDTDNSADILATVNAGNMELGGQTYSAKRVNPGTDDSSFGVSASSDSGDNQSGDTDVEWLHSPTDYTDTSLRNSNFVISEDIETVDNDYWDDYLLASYSDFNHELIMRNPLTNLNNNQKMWEKGLVDPIDIDWGNWTPATRYDGQASHSYSFYSPIITYDNYDYENYAKDIFDTADTDHDGHIYWNVDNQGIENFSGDYIIDGYSKSTSFANGCKPQYGFGGEPIEWLSSSADDYVVLKHDNTDDVAIDIIRLTPAYNARVDANNDQTNADDAFAYVPSVKKIKIALLEDWSDTKSIIDMWMVDVQQWCVTDIVLQVNPTLDADGAQIMGDGSGILFQVLEVWNEDYAAKTGNANTYGNIDVCFGGIAEVYLYGKDASSGYQELTTKLANKTLLEESYRLEDPKLQDTIDGGAYWVDEETENSAYRRSMSQGMYEISQEVNINNESIGSMRYSCGQVTPIRMSSTDFSSKFIAEYNAEFEQITELNNQIQLWSVIRIALQLICTALIAAASALTSPAGGVGGVFLATLAFGLGIFTAVQIATMVISTFNPEMADYLSRIVFDTIDMFIGTIISNVCQIMDKALNTDFFMKIGQPLLYGTYMFFSDPGGTIARGLVYCGATVFSDMNPNEMVFIISDGFERNLMSSTAFNMFDYNDPPDN